MTLYGIHELAKAAGVKPRTLAAYLARGKCPTPTARLAAGPVWTHEDVASWLEARDERLERLVEAGHKAYDRAVSDQMSASWDWETWRPLQAGWNASSGVAKRRRNGLTVKECFTREARRAVERGEGIAQSTADLLRRSEWAADRMAARKYERGDDGIPF